MKQTLHIIAYAAVAIAALVSCAKEAFKENAIPAGEPIEVSLNGQIGEFTPADATKATAESVVRVTWGSGDKVYVYDGSNASIGTLTVTPDNNNASYAMLSGTITASGASPAPSKLTLVYVKGATAAPAISGGKISVDLSSQNAAEVPFVLYTTVAYDAAALTKTNEYISFTFATSVMTVNCTGLQTGASGAVAAIDKAEIDGVSTACELTIDGSGVTAVAGTTPGKITRTGTSVFQQSDSRGSFRLALAADPAAPAARNILVHQGSKVSGAAFTPTTLAAGKSYNTVYQMGEYVAPPAGMLSGGFTVADPDGIANSGDETKVRFSKGNLVATIDASGAPTAWKFATNQYDYFGEGGANKTIGSTAGDVDLFGWSTDANSNNWGIHTKTGATQDYTTGSFKDWGKDYCEKNSITPDNTWRTLSKDEWTYLFNTRSNASNLYKGGVTVCGETNCVVLLPDDWAWDTNTVGADWQTGGYPMTQTGTKVTWEKMEKAGAVCLPAAGYRHGSNVSYVGSGFYWSSSAYSANDSRAYFVYFTSSSVNPAVNGARNDGYSVRLVTESSGGYAPAVKVTGVTISKEETSITVGGKKTLVATVAPANATNKQITWSSSKPSVATVNENGEVTGVAIGSANIFATTDDGNFKAVCLVTITPQPDYVVMNMGTGEGAYTRKWVTKNLGATTVAGSGETCYGDYYAWGETETYYSSKTWDGTSQKWIFNTWTQRGSNGYSWLGYSGQYSFIEWGEKPYDETTKLLKDEYDVVKQTFPGTSWRMPTAKEFDDLFAACGGSYNTTTNPGKDNSVGKGIYKCTNYDGVAGVLFVDGSGHKVFFPAAGAVNSMNHIASVTDGNYWSSTSSTYYGDRQERAAYLTFGSEFSSHYHFSRHFGRSIRPVSD